jgi:RNA polymerase sigma factor (sigma-70 family)
MPDRPIHAVVEFIHGLVVDPELASLSDSDLLKRFVTNRDENAFEALVLRHGPMVLALCRRILRDPTDAEDAFQAAFLVFVRRAASIARPELLGNWLYGVAFRTARAARAAVEKRRVKEAEAVPREPSMQEGPWQELQPFLDQELNRLPAKYRIPLVLCHLEEMSRQEAARALGLPEGTLSSRLARGRALLAQRLTRWRPSIAGQLLLAGFGKQALAAPLVQTTTRAGMSALVSKQINTGLVSAQVALLSQRVLRNVFMTKVKIAATVLCAGSLLAFVVGTAVSRGFRAEDVKKEAVDAAKNPGDSAIDRVLETTKNITDAQVKLRLLLRIAAVQDKTGDSAGAKKTRREAMELAKGFAAGSPRTETLLLVAWSQIEAKDRDGVLETFKEAEQAVAAIEDENVRAARLHNLVSAQAVAGDYEGGLRSLAKGGSTQGILLQGFGYQLNTENKDAARKAITKALAMFEGEHTEDQRASGLNGVCYALAKVGDLDQALKIAAKLGKGKEQDRCLHLIAGAQAGGGDVSGAARTAKSIEEDDIKVDALEAIAHAQAKAGDLDATRTTLNEIRKLVDKLQAQRQAKSGGFKQPRPQDPRLYQMQAGIALTQLQLGDKSAALVTVANIESDLKKADTLMRLASTLIAAGKSAEAREMLVAASQAAQRFSPNVGKGRWSQNEKANTLSFIAHKQAKAGDIKEAMRTADTIPTEKAMDDALAGIAPAQAEASDLKGALETVSRIRDESLKAEALEDIAETLTRGGREKDAQDLAEQQKSPAAKASVLLGAILGKAKAKLPSRRFPSK